MIPKEPRPKQKSNKTKAQPLSFSSLPDELVKNILARISNWNYPNLSLVSKRFLSIISSPELYTTRSRIGTTEPCLYFCLEDSPNISSPKWFSLRMKPANETLKDDYDIRGDYSLVPVPSSPHTHQVDYSLTIVFGSEIYLIGGPYREPSSSVRILDCKSHTWRDGPNMTVARDSACTALFDEKIYVMGGCDVDACYANLIEVFDIKTQTWTALPGPGSDEDDKLLYDYRALINVFEGKIYLAADEKDYTYDPKDGTWKLVRDKSSSFPTPLCIGVRWRMCYTVALTWGT
uniref:F-box domain-containing protein n=2 Tax=Brassica TaxID=3705 RepID=A0A3P5ZDU4_BRACM|nr:unnamed protein product [Brassica rapa]